MNRLKTSSALARLAGVTDEDSGVDDERLLCDLQDESKIDNDDAHEEQKEAQLTALPEDYDLVEEMREDNDGEALEEEEHFDPNQNRARDSESLDDEVSEQ